jgi:hypothetical protein
VTQHATLSPERWASFTSDEQLLMIANEMNRARSCMSPERDRSRRLAYERVLNLTDLTVGVSRRRSLRRELLRWRDLVAGLYLRDADPARHVSVFRALLQLSPAGVRQLRALGI